MFFTINNNTNIFGLDSIFNPKKQAPEAGCVWVKRMIYNYLKIGVMKF